MSSKKDNPSKEGKEPSKDGSKLNAKDVPKQLSAKDSKEVNIKAGATATANAPQKDASKTAKLDVAPPSTKDNSKPSDASKTGAMNLKKLCVDQVDVKGKRVLIRYFLCYWRTNIVMVIVLSYLT